MAEVIKTATRDAYGKALVELGEKNKNVVVLDADLAAATKTGAFKKAFPERFFDTGIAESNMMSLAGGLATTGFTVFASTFAMFAAGRAFEQVRNTIGYPHLNVKIGATHAGISVGEDGASHQCCEDIALMRSIPGMVIINPADDIEARAAVFAAAEHEGPVYMRFGRLAVPRVFDENYKFEIGKAVTLKEGTDVTIIATGLMVNEAIEAAKTLEAEGISVELINMHTIKPLDNEAVIKAAKKTGCIVTAEEHNIIGGLGSAVAEVVAEECPVPVVRVGVNDEFGKSGPAVELLHLYGLDAENIVKKAKLAISKK
ncbi:MAG: transketolase family protein [Ruminococcaceae bacterium]|nr:transketolase family protein [Oscillospiraceae bacterium]